MKRFRKGLVVFLIFIAVGWVAILIIDFAARQRAFAGNRAITTGYIYYLNPDFNKGGCLAYYAYKVNEIVYTGFYGDNSSNCAGNLGLGRTVEIEYSHEIPSYSRFTNFVIGKNGPRPSYVDSLIIEYNP